MLMGQKKPTAVIGEVSAFEADLSQSEGESSDHSELDDFIKCEACGDSIMDSEYEDHIIAHKLHQNMLEKQEIQAAADIAAFHEEEDLATQKEHDRVGRMTKEEMK